MRNLSPVTRAVIVVGLITAVGGGARFWSLGTPDEKVFDEVYYASDGCYFAGRAFDECGLEQEAERSWVHPPLGKLLIAAGVHGFGNTPVGWRVPGAAAGTATIALTGAIAFLLTRKAVWAGAAALLLAAEHLHFVQSRIAMLDVFLAFFASLGFLLLIWDRVRTDRTDRGEPADAPPPGGSPTQPATGPEAAAETPVAVEDRLLVSPPRRHAGPSGPRWLRVAAGGALGAGMAVKWSGVLALGGALILAVACERTRRARAGSERPLGRALAEEWPSLTIAFVLAPLLAYSVTWLGWLSDHGFSLTAWADNHVSIAQYHLGLDTITDEGTPIHPYMSRAWTWFLLQRPVAYFYAGGDAMRAEIIGIGNPLLFWGALLLVPYLAMTWWAQRDWRAGAILVPILAQYVPWLFVSRPLFLFYLTPVAPFLALAATAALRDLAGAPGRYRAARGAAAGVVVAVGVGLFAFFWPVLVGDPIGTAAWESRIWFTSWI